MPRPQFSQMLVERRRELGYSTGQAARALRLKEEVLEAFERGDFASMPKSGYAQGMLASYARFLGLDAQEVTDLFVEALDDYRTRGTGVGTRQRRGRDPRRMAQRPEGPVTNQPQVPSRGYLPTSGGIAGDLGDYATTSAARPHGQGRTYQQRTRTPRYPSSSLGQPMRTSRRSGDLPEDRYDQGARSAVRRARYDYGRDDITTMRVDPDQYVDDLRYDDTPRPYAPASTRGGRAPMRDMPTPDRPNVQRRPSSRQRQQVRGRGRRSEPQGFLASLTSDPLRFIGVVVVLVAIIITIILVFSVSSCGAFRTASDTDKTVPVSQTTTQDSTSDDTDSEQAAKEAAAAQEIASSAGKQDDATTSETQATVVVSVADDAVTWVEIECDGESKVAETVTGPWTQSYVVTSSITVQAADTTAVTVTNNGRQVQFDSRASGIGTVTIKVTKPSNTASGSDANATSTTSGGSSTTDTPATSSSTTTTDSATSSTSGSSTSDSSGSGSSTSTSGTGASGSDGTVTGSLGGSGTSRDTTTDD